MKSRHQLLWGLGAGALTTVALVGLEHFNTLFRALNVGAKGNAAIYRSDDFRQALRWPEVKGRLNVALPPDSPTRAAIAGAVKMATISITSAADGRVRIYSYHVLDGFPFFISIGVARDEALAGWRNHSLLVGLAVLGLLGALTMRLQRSDAAHSRLAAIVENSNDAIYSRTLDGIILTWNAGAERLFGHSAAQAIGQPVALILRPHLPDKGQQSNQGLLRNEAVMREFDCIARDGRTLTVSVNISPIRDNAGTLVGASGAMRDVTPLKQAQAALKDSEARLRATFEQTAVGIGHFDLQNRGVMVNQRFCAITGYTQAELLGKSTAFYNHPDDRGLGRTLRGSGCRSAGADRQSRRGGNLAQGSAAAGGKCEGQGGNMKRRTHAACFAFKP